MVAPYFSNLSETYTFANHEFQSLFFAFRIPASFYRGSYFMRFDVQEGQKPEDISLKVYGTDNYWYLILLYNKVKTPWFDGVGGWPLSNDEIETYSQKLAEFRYGANYTDANFELVSDEMFLINENLREIKLPHKETIIELEQLFLSQLKEIS